MASRFQVFSSIAASRPEVVFLYGSTFVQQLKSTGPHSNSRHPSRNQVRHTGNRSLGLKDGQNLFDQPQTNEIRRENTFTTRGNALVHNLRSAANVEDGRN